MTRPRLLDLFCGAGGAAMGYYRAGFDVVGIDHIAQKHYPFEFIQADALEYCAVHGEEFDVIHASPPCQAYSNITRGLHADKHYPDLIEPTRNALLKTGKKYVIENVPGAPLINPILLCGSMFGLGLPDGHWLRRHRYFEVNFFVGLTPACQHNKSRQAIGVYGASGGYCKQRNTYRGFNVLERSAAMGIDWMTNPELTQAIPPAYTEFIGRQIIAILEQQKQ